MKPGDLIKFKYRIGISTGGELSSINEGAVGIFINHFETGGRQYSNILVEGSVWGVSRGSFEVADATR